MPSLGNNGPAGAFLILMESVELRIKHYLKRILVCLHARYARPENYAARRRRRRRRSAHVALDDTESPTK